MLGVSRSGKRGRRQNVACGTIFRLEKADQEDNRSAEPINEMRSRAIGVSSGD